MASRKYRYFMCDFETSVYSGQTSTEVWASASVELYTEDVMIFHSIDEQFNYFLSLDTNIIAYYHNLKFDGAFWISYLLINKGFTQALDHYSDDPCNVSWKKPQGMYNNTFRYTVSDRGMWYTIQIKVNNHMIEIRDSLKLLPFSVRQIGKAFKTKHQKLDMEYTGFRYAGCEITEEEKKYIANDVLVVKEALEIMYDQGHKKLTIASCCMEEFKRMWQQPYDFTELFPNMYDIEIDPKLHKYSNAGEWIRRSYRGGWCYLVKGKENKVYRDGTTADVNSLYPSMLHSESGNFFPVGNPIFWYGNYIPDEALSHYYFVRIKTRFYIKPGKLPFIQIKSSFMYKGTESLESSDMYDEQTGQYYTHWKDRDGKLHDTRVELILTMTDYQLLKDHYYLVDFEIIDGCWFYSMKGLFDDYIDKYKKMKMQNTGALRSLAKLFLNSLYGRFASNTDSSFKMAYVKDDGSIGFLPVAEHNKKPGYIPVGSAITSYARNFTIRSAQENFHGVDKPGTIYCDTDSIHMDLQPEDVKGLKIHDSNFCCWKLESNWDTGYFTRQKTYIEHVTHENQKPVDEPYYNIKCAGMPDKCKWLFALSMAGNADPDGYIDPDTGIFKEWGDAEKEFLFDPVTNKPIIRTIEDFKIGLKVPGKLSPRRIPGGILLVDTTYEMR